VLLHFLDKRVDRLPAAGAHRDSRPPVG
jgi:hypothetical protein